MAMERVNRILSHPMWQGAVHGLSELEADRQFCRHDIDHLLHVARLAYIENFESGLNISKELIYAAALLHDIGRALQYTEGISHEEAGFAMAGGILDDCGFCAAEKEGILASILEHRDGNMAEAQNLSGLIYRADKLSRNCFACGAFADCNWSGEKKNMRLYK